MVRQEQWENTPSAPSGRSTDLTEVGKDKLIDLLLTNNEKLVSELSALDFEIKRLNSEVQKANDASVRWEQRTLAAEKRAEASARRAEEAERKAESDRAELQEKIDRLLSLVG